MDLKYYWRCENNDLLKLKEKLRKLFNASNILKKLDKTLLLLYFSEVVKNL